MKWQCKHCGRNYKNLPEECRGCGTTLFEKTTDHDNGFERIIDTNKDSTWMILRKDNKAVQFTYSDCLGGFDVGYHSPDPMYDDQEPMENCNVIEGDCYYDGSSLRAVEWYNEFIFSGKDEELIWEKLERVWRGEFEN